MAEIGTGDTVLHKPTGEIWVVACVEGKHLSWCGWPEGTALVADCELKEKASDEYREALLKNLASMKGNDHRQRYAARLLAGQEAKQ